MDEILIEIETDKVVLEVPAPAAGVLAEIIVGDGGTVVATRSSPRSTPKARLPLPPCWLHLPPASCRRSVAAAAAAPASAAMAGVAMPAAAADGRQQPAWRPARSPAPAGWPRHQGDAPPLPPPSGTGPGLPKALLAQVAAPSAVALGDRPEQRVPMSRLRARVAERLLQSQSTNAILTTFNEVNMAPVMDMRKVPGPVHQGTWHQAGLHELLRQGCGARPQKFPVLNASVDGNDIVYHGYFDIGIAVGSPRGLVVPILRNADQMSFADIEKKIAEFGKKAAEGKLGIEEMTGGTFSISNGGTFGSMLSTRSSTRRSRPSWACTPPGPRRGRKRPDRDPSDELPGDVPTTASSTAAKPCWAWSP